MALIVCPSTPRCAPCATRDATCTTSTRRRREAAWRSTSSSVDRPGAVEDAPQVASNHVEDEPAARPIDPDKVRSDTTPASEVSREAAIAISAQRDRAVEEARRASRIWLMGMGVAIVGLTFARGTSLTAFDTGQAIPRLPLWVPVAAIATAFGGFVSLVRWYREYRYHTDALSRHPLRAWTRPVTLQRRGRSEAWLLLYATGKSAPVAPFAAVPCVTDWPVAAPALVVDVAGIPKKGCLLTVFDAATGRVLAMG